MRNTIFVLVLTVLSTALIVDKISQPPRDQPHDSFRKRVIRLLVNWGVDTAVKDDYQHIQIEPPSTRSGDAPLDHSEGW